MNVKAIVFDLDDTLYSEYDYVKSGLNFVGKEIARIYGISNAENELFELFHQSRFMVFNRYLIKHHIYNNNSVGELIKIYRSHRPNITLSKEILWTLKKLRNSGNKLGIITDGRPDQQRIKIKALGLEKLVDKIIITDDLGGMIYRKPHPKSFEIICETFGILPGEMIYVGDNPEKDFAIKKFLPIFTVRIMGKGIYAGCEYLDGVTPDKQIRNFSDLTSFLRKKRWSNNNGTK